MEIITLRAINAVMQSMAPIQLGLPVLLALPKDWKSIILDIKDCFFSIPLHPDDIENLVLQSSPLIMDSLMPDMNGKSYPKGWPIVQPYVKFT